MSGFPGRMAFAKQRTSAPKLQSGMIVITEKLSASEEGFYTVFESAHEDSARQLGAGSIPQQRGG